MKEHFDKTANKTSSQELFHPGSPKAPTTFQNLKQKLNDMVLYYHMWKESLQFLNYSCKNFGWFFNPVSHKIYIWLNSCKPSGEIMPGQVHSTSVKVTVESLVLTTKCE